ncbi:hypothetical protein ACNAN0_04675 [Agrilactobacillus fermenti]|uniref:hypothetical protein n=1 Tax=Agrilactobacillus fermenti TaxID=2586909 RepID=UPI001E5496B5|nr:hypothetical protein [Agrilactobacillus fermenti]MCD2256706.1 hypothetical protein [Agrilactobacillus fermenti]
MTNWLIWIKHYYWRIALILIIAGLIIGLIGFALGDFSPKLFEHSGSQQPWYWLING